MNKKWPRPIAVFLIHGFARIYNINVQEAEKPIESYDSIGAFFIRHLKPGLRPIDAQALIVHPADSKISQISVIQDQTLIQAKGRTYTVSSLLGVSDVKTRKTPTAMESVSTRLDKAKLALTEGGVFATYYLCPTDYHRVHSPVEGVILSATYLPGALWPVNQVSVSAIDNLFGVNERIVIEIEVQDKGQASTAYVVMVGATNVGKMSLAFDVDMVSNEPDLFSGPTTIRYQNPKKVLKGQELGVFHMGSTVVVVYEKNLVDRVLTGTTAEKNAKLASQFKEQTVRMGQGLV